jgi:hypothetical protein
MKQLIRDIIKEEISVNKDKFQRKVLDVLSKEGFNGATSYETILQFLNNHLAIKGMEAFEMYQLHKDNWRTFDSEPDLIRKDISKTKIKTANIRGRELVLNKRYSMSTKKQMSQLRPYGQGDIIKTSKDKLWDIIKKK